MKKTENIKTSKFLSMVLRHKPEKIGIELDENGWVAVEELISKVNYFGKKMDLESLKYIVETNSKKRFAFNEDKTKIRANQGHSIDIKLGYEPQVPPQILFHGTAKRFADSILEKGLIKKERHHVHLSLDESTALKVGQRHGKPIIFMIQAGQMNKDGFDFFCSDNGVWLTNTVPSKYLKIK